ncbi:MAG: DUF5677 domain-containing protein [Planctomycetaceae bacterium]
MFPCEDKNRSKIRRQYESQFTDSAELVDGSVEFLETLGKTASNFSEETRAFLIGTFAREIRRFRSINLLCEFGLTENAEILTRSGFEGLMSLHYVLGIRVPDDEISNDLKNRIRSLPEFPKDISKFDFRVALYLAKEAQTYLKVFPDDGDKRKDEINYLKELVGQVGEQWKKTIKDTKTYSGLNIRQLAEYCKLTDIYEEIYPLLCNVSHAGDASRFVGRNDDSEIVIKLVTDHTKIPPVLELSSLMLLKIVSAMEIGFDLVAPEVFGRFLQDRLPPS